MLRIEEISEAVKSPKIQVKHKNVCKKTDETHAPMDTDIQNSYPRGEAERFHLCSHPVQDFLQCYSTSSL